MRDFRYHATQKDFDAELSTMLDQHEAEKQSSDEVPEPDHGIKRIAEKKTPLDEVQEAIAASRRKSAAEEIREHEVRRKLASLNNRNG